MEVAVSGGKVALEIRQLIRAMSLANPCGALPRSMANSILRRGRRQILGLGVTAHPTPNAWQLAKACGWERPPMYIVRDRDSDYGEFFARRLRAMGIRDRPTAPQSPWQNGHTERLIGSIQRECLDHVVVFGERHLRHILLSYMEYYNDARTHLFLNLRMRRYRGLFRPLGAFSRHQFSADYTISMFGFDFRQIPCLSARGKYCGHRDRQLSRSLA